MSFNSYSNEDQLYMDRAPDGQKVIPHYTSACHQAGL